MKERLMTIDELSKYLSIPKGSLYNMVNEGKIPHLKVGKRVRFCKREIDEWLEAQKIRAVER